MKQRLEVKFSDPDADFEIGEGLKTATLRQEQGKYHLPPGERITAVCGENQSRHGLVVVQAWCGSIRELPIVPLALDKMFTRRDAVKMQDADYGDKPRHTLDSQVSYIAFITDMAYRQLGDDGQKRLLDLGVTGALRVNAYSKLFLPSIVYGHTVRYPDESYKHLLGWMSDNNAVPPERIRRAEEHLVELPRKNFNRIEIEKLLFPETPDDYRVGYERFVLLRR